MERTTMKLITVQYHGERKPFGRVLALRMLLEKFKPCPGPHNAQGKEDTCMCFDPKNVDQDKVEEQEQTDVPKTDTVAPVETNEPVAA